MDKKHLFITGRPGIGKTTIIKRVAETLHKKGIKYSGFITEELREGGKRVGFILREIPGGKTGLFAHIDILSPYRVGKYGVNLKEFEKLALPLLRGRVPLLIIDEIGTMELFSVKFKNTLREIIRRNSPLLLATIGERHLGLLDKWGLRNKVEILVMDYKTREELVDKIIEWLRENLEVPLASN
jgi:nucleoside-triphosphatase